MASLMRFVNRLLPFATPGTPLIQDVIHLGVLCVLLYFAPQIQEYLQRRNEGQNANPQPVANEEHAVEGGYDGGVFEGQEPRNVENEDDDESDQDPEPGANDPDFRAFQRDQINEADGAGPADAGGAVNMPPQRNVGAKKAKSLARRDQRRAYHEFQRAQGEAQRARDAEGASEREAAQAAERERRKAVEAELEAKKAREREQKREQEKKEREEEQARRERAVAFVRQALEERRMCNLYDVMREIGGADVNELWVERILNANGMLGKREDGSLTMITATGYIARVTSDDVRRVYEKAVEDGVGDEGGKIGYEELGAVLEKVLKAGPAVAAH